MATILAAAAHAQIRLVPGPQRVVAHPLTLITAAYFNRDGFEDVAGISNISSKVSVLFGQQGGNSFGRVTDIDTGRALCGLTSGDFDGDGFADIAVADFLDSTVIILAGNGDGTFSVTSRQHVCLHPVDVTTGNFDHEPGDDLVVICEASIRVLSRLRDGAAVSVSPTFPFRVGPTGVAATDLNGDGFADIVITSATADDGIVVLLNDGAGGFGRATADAAANGAADLAIADFNGDGAPDIAVLETGTGAAQTSYAIAVLVNQTVVTDSTRAGTGTFVAQSPLVVKCPSSLGGIAIYCHANHLVAADFDDDGFNDLVVSVSTQPQVTSPAAFTSGLVQAFQGSGNSTFDFSTMVVVGSGAGGIVVGDFNGDGLPDLAIAEPGSGTVRIINVPRDQGCRTYPCPCHLGRQCASGSCVDGVCCETPACPRGQFCNLPGSEGTCQSPRTIYSRCTDGYDCATGFCVDGLCCSAVVCPAGEFCNNPDGTCRPPASNGIKCNTNNDQGGDNQCASGHCTDGVCCDVDRCEAGRACNVPGFEGSCAVRCSGDCRGDGTVSVDELVLMVNAALGNQSACALGDANGDGVISVDDLMVAVNNLLHGCS